MSVELQQIKRNSSLAEWAEMVRTCKNSGLTVKAWCKEQGLNEKTYYYRQKQLCNALPEKAGNAIQFAEIRQPVIDGTPEDGIHIRIGTADISVHSNADLDLLREVLRIVTETC